MRFDGHIHSPFCPHGSPDALADYAERAIQLGFNGITFTEHAPLPAGFTDPVPAADSAMAYADLPRYFQAIKDLKKEYQNHIQIFTGLEVDFIEGFEEETDHFLGEVKGELDDAILSVHFLKHNNVYWCMDYSEDMFEEMTKSFGSTDHVYASYYRTVKASVSYPFRSLQPKRIGHITLARKFKKLYPSAGSFKEEIYGILDIIQERGLELDYNGAGTVKPLCGEPYPSDWVVREAVKRKIPLVYGSDAHTSAGINQGYDQLLFQEKLASPLFLNRTK
ncbi:histidinol-phosphatase HisJ [Fictibacillus aquaticus]|uniref:Histidinol-phosphatase n=1 Tax=Fictibacillus aquaticus TaxID=2021314 RepID=A0A235FA55_9BACL|nr:histidinol-phosphatase HisJ [Fictibacillus aquaticus]OYD58216.1 histidinol phosphatase [Fictibacillus aquaticus]